jgi:anti-anti-sigma regulatory factor
VSEPRSDGWVGEADEGSGASDGSAAPMDGSAAPMDGGGAVATRIGPALIVTLPRELTDATLASLRGGVMARLRRARARAIVFEASGLDTIDAAEFADLSAVARTSAWLGVRPMLVGLSAGIVAYLVNTGVDTSAFEPYGTLDDALVAIAPAAVGAGTATDGTGAGAAPAAGTRDPLDGADATP